LVSTKVVSSSSKVAKVVAVIEISTKVSTTKVVVAEIATCGEGRKDILFSLEGIEARGAQYGQFWATM